MPDTYTAITIGPIYDTIRLTSSPAGLWAASYLFSHISRRLCELIADEKLAASEEDIVSPYFSKADQKTDGIGRYHDRIVFQPADAQTVLAEVQKLFDQVAGELAAPFDKAPAGWFKKYLQLRAICFESKGSPILDCAQYLDAIELEKTFPADGDHPLADLLDSDDNDRNIRIRNKIRDTFSAREWPFPVYSNGNREERLPDMEDITGRRKEVSRPRCKINSYYAIVQTDGDRFGDYIKGCRGRGESEREFSKKCLGYCTAAAELVQTYGGVPIYAGGDDLLFIAPLTGKTGGEAGSILEFLDALRREFEAAFGEKKGDPTLSLGVVIRYYKYPLYEAFDEAYRQLFHKAKRNRNAAAISLQKHSGQTVEFVLENFKDTAITKKVGELMKRQISGEVLQSVQSKIWELEHLFRQALSFGDAALKNAFDNTFDNNIHDLHQDELELVRELLALLPGASGADSLKLLDGLLRFAKFWGEEGDDGDA